MTAPARERGTAPGTRRRTRLAVWATIGVVLLLVAIIGSFLSQAGQWTERGTLDPDSAAPAGTRALARVLAEQGIEVRIARDRADAEAALTEDSTLVLPDAPALGDDAVRALADAAGTVVLVEPRSRTLDLLLPGSTVRGASSSPLAPECDAASARRAGDVTVGGLYLPGPGVTGCYPSGDGAGLLLDDRGGRSIAALDARAVFANEYVDDAGNAALALSLLGTNPTLVWYVPALDDAEGAAPTLGELTPPWVTPVALLLIAAALSAALWRGRRFGPLVAENLPVTVRATETSTGRARLYARSRDAAHAADQLRSATRGRVARLLALGIAPSPGAVADAAAERSALDRTMVRSILIDSVVGDDRELVDLYDRLNDLETRVRAAVRPEGTPR